ncbi:MAG: glycerol-3-phosphate dehydrogenase/oxidase [Methanobacteriota archaeon]|nr:MAG: glycerol-3-phosphate dehydrogenase/oxidase [Euryarchaeota archaeon]
MPPSGSGQRLYRPIRFRHGRDLGGGIDVTEFSARTRAANLDRLRDEAFDVLVVGGGIVGAGVARDAACRGLRTALVERGDFASGTSGKTSRLIHGGLRYLRSYRVGLVRQAVRERDLLLARAPSLVHPLPFVIPAYRGRRPGAWFLRFGLFLYDFLSRDKTVPRRLWLAADATVEREPRLSSDSLAGAGMYYDAWTDDARLVLAVVKDAAEAGACVANYTEVVELLHDGGGRGTGARLRDVIENRTFDASARIVVNATGVWLDRLRAPRGIPTIRATKGIHILLPRTKVGNRHALALTAPRDGRIVFVLPWNELALVGTTDTDFGGDADHVVPNAGDVAYLLDVVNSAFPQARVTTDDIVSAYAGLRPLLRTRRIDARESDISREHAIFEDNDGLISVAGGKLTTHRSMAEDVVDLVSARLERTTATPTKERPLGPPIRALSDFTTMGFDEASALHLQARLAPEQVRRYLEAPRARDRIVDDLPHVWAEVEVAIHEEMAMTLVDVLVRRLGLFYEARDQALGVADEVAERMAETLGWDASRVEREARLYRERVAEHRKFRENRD